VQTPFRNGPTTAKTRKLSEKSSVNSVCSVFDLIFHLNTEHTEFTENQSVTTYFSDSFQVLDHDHNQEQEQEKDQNKEVLEGITGPRKREMPLPKFFRYLWVVVNWRWEATNQCCRESLDETPE